MCAHGFSVQYTCTAVCPSAETVHEMADICGYRINLGIQYKEQYNRDT